MVHCLYKLKTSFQVLVGGVINSYIIISSTLNILYFSISLYFVKSHIEEVSQPVTQNQTIKHDD